MKLLKLFLSILICLLITGCGATHTTHANTDAVIFSFDRPLQLFALLESMHTYMSGINEVHVIYRSSNADFQSGYNTVFSKFPEVKGHPQSANPTADFKPLTLQATFDSPSAYVIFAVDDIVVKEKVDLNECVSLLKKYNAYGFFLRLGTHLNHNYPTNSAQAVPPLTQVEPNIYQWRIGSGAHDWGYPHTVDMTLYRKKEIEPALRQLPYHNPNKLEGNWSGLAHTVMNRTGLCFASAKMVNLPLNRVQNTYANRSMNEFSPQELLDIFKQGKKMDIQPLASIVNKSAHMEYSPTFVARTN